MTIKHCLRVYFSLYLLKMFQFVVNVVYPFTFQAMAGDGLIYHLNCNKWWMIYLNLLRREDNVEISSTEYCKVSEL